MNNILISKWLYTIRSEYINKKIVKNGKIYKIRNDKDILTYYAHMMTPIINQITKSTNCIILLCDDWGKDMYYIINKLKQRSNIYYYIYVMRNSNKHKPLKRYLHKSINLCIKRININNPIIKMPNKYRNTLIFTHCFIKNTRIVGMNFFNQLFKIDSSCKVIHLEPVGWQIGNKDKIAYSQGDRLLSQSNAINNANLYKRLRRLEKSNDIIIDKISIDNCDYANDPCTLMMWHKKISVTPQISCITPTKKKISVTPQIGCITPTKKFNMTTNIVHIIYPITSSNHIYRYKRTVLQYTNTKSIEYYVIMPIKFKSLNIYNEDGKYKIMYYSTPNDMVKTINKLSPVSIILSVSPLYYPFYNNITCKNYYYIHHGLVTNEHVDFKKSRWHENFKYIIGCKKLYRVLGKCFGTTQNFIKIKGLPQLDIIINNCKNNLGKNKKSEIYKRYNIDSAKKTILIPTAGGIYNKTNTVMIKIKNIITDTKIPYHIFIKNKIQSYNKYFDKIGDNIVCLLNNDNFYDFLYCDYIIVEEGGTAFLEGLMVNRKTILYQVDNPNDYFDISDKYGLLIAKTMNQFIKYVNMIIHDDPYINSDKYLSGIKAFIYDSVGEIEMVTNKIIDIVTKK